MKNIFKKGLQCGLAASLLVSGLFLPQTYSQTPTVFAQEAAPAHDATVDPAFAKYLTDCWDKRQSEIDVSDYHLTWDELTSIIFQIHYEQPQYYYVMYQKGYVDADRDGYVETLTIDYPLDRRDELEAEWNILNEKLIECKTDLEKIVIVHDHLCETIQYTDRLGSTSHDIEGAILEKRCVCEGYALAFKYYLNRLGIPCKVVTGVANAPHAWNQVQVDGKWYMVDATHDDTRNPKTTAHKYFLKSAYRFAADHTWDLTPGVFHECNDTRFDEMFWNQVFDDIAAYQGTLYFSDYVHTSQGFIAGIYSYDTEDPNAEKQLLIPVHDEWRTEDGTTSTSYSGVAVKDGVLYYSLPRSVWKLDLKVKDAKPEQVFALPEGTQDYIWDIRVLNGKIYYDGNPTEKGIREYESYTFANFEKLDHPLAVTADTIDVGMGGEQVIFQAAAPGAITYESLNPDILDTYVTFEDMSCELIPKKLGTATLKVTAQETDRFHKKEKLITVNVVKNEPDVQISGDKKESYNGKIRLSGSVHTSKMGTGHVPSKPTGSVTIQVYGNNQPLLSEPKTIALSQYCNANYSVEVPAGYQVYKLVVTYSGNDFFREKIIEKIYTDNADNSLHTHHFVMEIATPAYLKSSATLTNPAIYYKSCVCGQASHTDTFSHGNALGFQSSGSIETLPENSNPSSGSGQSITLEEQKKEDTTVSGTQDEKATMNKASAPSKAVAKTGDNTKIGVLISVLAISVIAILYCLIRRKHRK